MSVLFAGSLLQRLRLVSGLLLFAFAASHFLNHAVGLLGVDAMLTAQEWRLSVTRWPPVSAALGAALIVHIVLALVRIARIRTLKMPLWEAGQIALGLAIPFWLFPHILNTHFANALFDVQDSYVYELLQLWPNLAVDQSALLLIVWLHGCIGLHYWLRLAPWYGRVLPLAYGLAVLIPFAALAGFMVAGEEVQRLAAEPQTLAEMQRQTNWPQGEALEWLAFATPLSYYAFYPLLALAAGVIGARFVARRAKQMVAVDYVPEPTVRSAHGPTLLEISRANAVPHMSVCGGRARCSTCRVEVLEGLQRLPPAEAAEAETLARIGAAANVRLACQIRPQAPLRVRQLVRPGSQRTRAGDDAQGVERTLAVLFLDIRGFTNWSQARLPYDVVFILNRMFGAAGEAIEAHGGWIDKYMGDGLMAVFGRESGAERGCQQALAAAAAIDLAIENVNRELKDELGRTLRFGIGIHVGPLVIGEIGHEGSAAMTVIGRSVNTASRLEATTKELRCQLVVSRAVTEKAGLKLRLKPRAVQVRGLDEPIEVFAVKRARDLPKSVLS